MKSFLLAFSVLLLWSSVSLEAQSVASAAPFIPLTQNEQASLISKTKSEQLEDMRDSVRSGRYGQRGLNRIFKNFEGNTYLDPEIPGVQKNIRLLNSPSWQQAKGAIRTLLYGTQVQNDDRFDLLALDKPVNSKYGRTDKDLLFRHRVTGQMCRIEVKDVTTSSQRSGLAGIKEQIDKMAAEYQETGELQAWANRQEAIPEVVEYARLKGIPVFSGVKQRDFGQVLDYFNSKAVFKSNLRLLGGLFETGSGLVLVYEEAPATVGDIENLWNPEMRNTPAWLKLGRDASLTGMGASFTISGTMGIASRFAGSAEWFESVQLLGEWAGPIGLGFYVVAEGFDEGVAIVDYRNGAMTPQQFFSKSAGVATGLGSVALGAAIGTVIEPGGGTLVGAGIGALVGVPASMGTTHVVDMHYAGLDAEHKHQLEQAIYAHYGMN